jgi:hypothetical protein
MGVVLIRTPDTGPLPDVPTHLYLMRCERFAKIGIAQDVARRQAALQPSCPFPISVELSIRLASFTEARAHERRLHAKFAHWRTIGEWFDGDTEAIRAAMLAVPAAPEPAPVPAPKRDPRPVKFSGESPEMQRMRRAARALNF